MTYLTRSMDVSRETIMFFRLQKGGELCTDIEEGVGVADVVNVEGISTDILEELAGECDDMPTSLGQGPNCQRKSTGIVVRSKTGGNAYAMWTVSSLPDKPFETVGFKDSNGDLH